MYYIFIKHFSKVDSKSQTNTKVIKKFIEVYLLSYKEVWKKQGINKIRQFYLHPIVVSALNLT